MFKSKHSATAQKLFVWSLQDSADKAHELPGLGLGGIPSTPARRPLGDITNRQPGQPIAHPLAKRSRKAVNYLDMSGGDDGDAAADTTAEERADPTYQYEPPVERSPGVSGQTNMLWKD